MKIFPDPMYARMQCGASRLSSGSSQSVPFFMKKLPTGSIPEKFRPFAAPAVICTLVVAAFYEPILMLPLVLLWSITSWVIGTCPHCTSLAERDAYLSADWDDGDL